MMMKMIIIIITIIIIIIAIIIIVASISTVYFFASLGIFGYSATMVNMPQKVVIFFIVIVILLPVVILLPSYSTRALIDEKKLAPLSEAVWWTSFQTFIVIKHVR